MTEVISLTRRSRFAPQEYSWYSFLFEAESTPGPYRHITIISTPMKWRSPIFRGITAELIWMEVQFFTATLDDGNSQVQPLMLYSRGNTTLYSMYRWLCRPPSRSGRKENGKIPHFYGMQLRLSCSLCTSFCLTSKCQLHPIANRTNSCTHSKCVHEFARKSSLRLFTNILVAVLRQPSLNSPLLPFRFLSLNHAN
jgi:hypothetical protein